MNSYCPVCLALVQGTTCSHCGTDVEQMKKLRTLEKVAEGRNTLPTLHQVARLYRRMGRTAALGRILNKLADHTWMLGQWVETQHYLEQLLALGDEAGTTAFRTQVKRQLGLLLGRRGELPLGYHLLSQAEHEGDWQALIGKMRLEMDERTKRQVLQSVARLEKIDPLPPIAKAWRLEALVRFSNLPNDLDLREALALPDPMAKAIAQRALGIWQMNHQESAEAKLFLRSALSYFKEQQDLYEQGRTLMDLARAYLLGEFTRSPAETFKDAARATNDANISKAVEVLGEAVSLFRRLGTPLMDAQASELAETLTLGRSNAPTVTLHSQAAALIWLGLDGVWGDKVWEQVLQTAQSQGGIPEKMLGGVLIFFGEAHAKLQVNVVADTALALYDLMLHFKTRQKLKAKDKFHLTVVLGSVPQHPQDLTQTLRALPRSKLFQKARTLKDNNEQILVNQRLYLGTQSHYRYAPHQTDGEETWWRLLTPQHDPHKVTTPKRFHLKGYQNIFKSLDSVLDIFKQRQLGGLVSVVGAGGTGKSRLLNVLIEELQTHSKGWLIHLRAREATRHEPFGAIRHWLGEGFEPPKAAAAERRLSHIATFRRSIVGLLHSRPLILAVDDVHLLDSGSLEALRAILPLIATHNLMIVLTARSGEIQEWHTLVELARRALPERSTEVELPPEMAYQPAEMPDDVAQQHLLACAAVLGDRFLPLVLRRVAALRDVYFHLGDLLQKGILAPAEEAHYWRFSQTAARDHLYEKLDPAYRATLHWYARQTLKVLGLDADEHIHPAGLPDPALRISMRRAQEALTLDSPQEALLHFDRALEHYQGEEMLIELYLGKATALLSLNDLAGVQDILNKLQAIPNLDPHDEASLLIFQGELFYRVGEVASLFRIYEQAAAKLRALPDADVAEQVSIIYAQALGRFKRDELEMARSMIGGALLMAQGAGLDHELADFWDLIAQIHQKRHELEPAKAAIQKAITSYQAAGAQWQLLKPLERYGMLMMDAGELDDAHQQLKNALDLAEAIGDRAAMIRLHQLLGKIGLYRGEFGKMTAHLASALHVALFADSLQEVVLARVALAEGLALEGRLVAALQQATLALSQAEQSLDKQALAAAQLVVSRVTLALNCPDDAEQALRQAEYYIQTSTPDPALKLQVHLMQMQVALVQKDHATFEEALTASRNLPHLGQVSFWRARRGLLLGQHNVQLQEWNNAAREFEWAAKLFAKLGATYWQRQAQAQLQKIAAHAPGYQQEGRYHLRGEGADQAEQQK